MDFLLECIGFPPDHDLDDLARLARSRGEPVAWRGPAGEHLRLPLGGGLDLRMDQEEGAGHWTLYPHFQSSHRLRLAVEGVQTLPDSPSDALVRGWANPPLGGDPRFHPEAYPLSAILTDARRLPRRLGPGHVLAVSLAAFALDVEHVGPERAEVPTDRGPWLGRTMEDGGWVTPLGGLEDPGGCVDLCLRVGRVDAMRNPVTDAEVTRLELDTPGRPLVTFTSPWQLDSDRLPAPEVGGWISGSFLLTGRVAGGLTSPSQRVGHAFG